MFSVVDAVLLRPLPFEDPARLVMVWEDASRVGFPRNTPAPASWVDWRRQNTVFTDIAALRGAAYSLTGDGPPGRVQGPRAQMAETPLTLDWRVLLFTAALTLLTGIAFGVSPALTLGRVEVHGALKQGGRTWAGGGRQRLRDLQVVSQTALALARLTGAGLMIETLRNLHRLDLGLRPDHVLTLSTQLPRSRYPDHARREAFYRQVLERVSALPGVASASYTSNLPLTTFGNTSGYIVESQTSAEANTQDALFRVVTPGFLDTVGARVREGRLFTSADRASSEPVVIVNETLADRHWPRGSAVGRRLSIDRREPRWLTVVGAVKEIRERGLNIETKPAVYMPSTQSDGYWPIPADLAVRTSVDPVSLLAAVRQAIASVDPDQPVSQIRTMTQVVDEQVEREGRQMTVLSALAALAVVLAATGIYAVIAYAVAQRRREIGVRMALGAKPGHVLRIVLGRGALLIGSGIALGAALSFAGARLIQSLLFGVSLHDPAIVAASAALLALVAFAARGIGYGLGLRKSYR